MKKNLLIVLSTLLVGMYASAGNVLVVLRFDHDGTTFNDEATRTAPTTKLNNTRTYLTNGRLQFKNNLNDDISYFVGLRLENESQNARRYTDQLPEMVDAAWIDVKFNPNTNLTVGRVETEILGFDGLSSLATYMSSRARADVVLNYYYGTGLKLAYKFLEGSNVIKLMTFDQSEGGSTAAPATQTKSFMGAVYKGKFMGDTIQPILSYHKDNRQNLAVGSDPSTLEMAAASIKWDPKPFSISLDCLRNTRTNMSTFGPSAVNVANKKNVMTSYVLGGSYQFNDRTIGRIKLDKADNVLTDSTANTDTKTDFSSGQLTVEYKPDPKDFYYYHAGAYRIETRPSGADTQTETHLLAGIVIVADVLK